MASDSNSDDIFRMMLNMSDSTHTAGAECVDAGCGGGCKKSASRVTTDGVLCIECGTTSNLPPGQASATGRIEFEGEKHAFAQSSRIDRIAELNGPLVRVIHSPMLTSCRICITRAVGRVADNRMTAGPFMALLKLSNKKFDDVVDPFLVKLETSLQASLLSCSHNSYFGTKTTMSQGGKDKLNWLKRLVGRACEVVVGGSLETLREKSEGSIIDSVKSHSRTALESVSTQLEFKKALRSVVEKCKDVRARHANAGSSAAEFIISSSDSDDDEDGRVIRLDPLVRRLKADTAPIFASSELNVSMAMRNAKHVQTVAESMLEGIAHFQGLEYCRELVEALTNKETSPITAAETLEEYAVDARYISGAYRNGKLLYNSRMCCDDDDCKKKMFIGSSKFGSSKVFGISTGDFDGVWRLQTRLIGAFALSVACSENPPANGLELARAASKEIYLKSNFFATRQSEVIATCSTLMALQGKNIVTDPVAQQAIKHDLSVHAIAVSLGFWPKYFAPCFDELGGFFGADEGSIATTSARTALVEFTKCVNARMLAFKNEKGNASIDAALLYRRVVYMHCLATSSDKTTFASTVRRGAGAITFVPNLPQEVFKNDVNLEHFAGSFQQFMKYASDANRSGSDDGLVRRSEYSSLEYDALLKCIRCNQLGVGAYYEAEAGQRDLNAEQFATIQKPSREDGGVSNAVPRDRDICRENILSLVDFAADRVELSIPGFWAITWSGIDELKSIPASQTIFEVGHHPAGSLLKRIDNSHYKYTQAATNAPPPAVNPLADASFATSASPLSSVDVASMQLMLDLEVALAVLMHGVNRVTPPLIGSAVLARQPKCDSEMAISSILVSKSWVGVVSKLYDVNFISAVVEFCDNAATRVIESQMGNMYPLENPDDCPVARLSESFFHGDNYALRARRLHIDRLNKLIASKFATNGARDDASLEQASKEVYEDGEYGTLTYPNAKRTVSSQNVAALARSALNGYNLVTALVGSEWVKDDFDMKHILETADAVHRRFFVFTDASSDIEEHRIKAEEVLKSAHLFGSARANLIKKTGSYSQTSGTSTKIASCEDSVDFLNTVGQLYNSRNECHWHILEKLLHVIDSETKHVQLKLDARSQFNIRAIERSATVLDDQVATQAKQQVHVALLAMFADKAKNLKAEWEAAGAAEAADAAASFNQRQRAEAIALSLSDAGATGFEVYCTRGSLRFILGMCKESPLEMFICCYRLLQRHIHKNEPGFVDTVSREARSACREMFNMLQVIMLKLNTSRMTMSESPSVWRHPVFVLFVVKSALTHGTIIESREAAKILESGVCFLTNSVGFYKKTILSDWVVDDLKHVEYGDQEDASENFARSDRLHLDNLKAMKASTAQMRDSEEEVLVNAHRDARMRGGSPSAGMRLLQMKHRMRDVN